MPYTPLSTARSQARGMYQKVTKPSGPSEMGGGKWVLLRSPGSGQTKWVWRSSGTEHPYERSQYEKWDIVGSSDNPRGQEPEPVEMREGPPLTEPPTMKEFEGDIPRLPPDRLKPGPPVPEPPIELGMTEYPNRWQIFEMAKNLIANLQKGGPGGIEDFVAFAQKVSPNDKDFAQMALDVVGAYSKGKGSITDFVALAKEAGPKPVYITPPGDEEAPPYDEGMPPRSKEEPAELISPRHWGDEEAPPSEGGRTVPKPYQPLSRTKPETIYDRMRRTRRETGSVYPPGRGLSNQPRPAQPSGTVKPPTRPTLGRPPTTGIKRPVYRNPYAWRKPGKVGW